MAFSKSSHVLIGSDTPAAFRRSSFSYMTNIGLVERLLLRTRERMPQRDLDRTRDVEVGLRRLLGSRRGGAARRRDEHDRREDRRLQPHPIFPPRSGGLAPRPPRSGGVAPGPR